jgi:hypothetical protein
MIDEIPDPPFERDLRAVLAASEPADAPAFLYEAVAAIPLRTRTRRGWGGGRMALAGLAMAAVVIVAVGAVALALRSFGDLRVVGGPRTPAPTSVPGTGQRVVVTYRVMPNGDVQPGPVDIDQVSDVLHARIDASLGTSLTTMASSGIREVTVKVEMDATDEAAVQDLRQLLGSTGRFDFVPLGDEAAVDGQRLDLTVHPPLFSGDQVSSASIGSDQVGSRTLDLALRPDGARLFAAYTAANIGRYFAIVLDGTVISAPVINASIPNGEVQISSGEVGGFSTAEAQTLVTMLRTGPLPFPVEEVSFEVVPTATDGSVPKTPVPSDLVLRSPSPSPVPSATPDEAATLVAAARAYADAAGIAVTPEGSPAVTTERPDYDDTVLPMVTLPLAGMDGAALRVYFDVTGRIAVVSDAAGSARPVGKDVSRDGALAAAAQELRLAGIDPAEGTLTVVKGALGEEWYITLDRSIDGVPVANTPAMWRIAGDRAYVDLRSDATLIELYAIRPPNGSAPQVMPTADLDTSLAAVAGLTANELAALHPALAWVRAVDDATGLSAETLSLGYCATKVLPDGSWSGWCVDAGTGQQSVVVGGVD